MSKKGENIYKRKDGRWEARYIKGYREDGRARYLSCYGKTYRQAKEKLDFAKAEFLNGSIPTENKRKQFGAYCDEWLCINRSRIKESTYVKYDTVIKKHIKPELGGCRISAISTALIGRFGRKLLEKNFSSKTVRDILTVVHSILEYTQTQEPGMPSVRVIYPKEEKKQMRVLSRQEQTKLTAYLLADMDECKFGVLLSLLTGLRIGEICALKWKDITLSDRTLTVSSTMMRIKDYAKDAPQKTKVVLSDPKTNTSSRVIPLTEYAVKLCLRWQVCNPDAFILTGRSDRYVEPRALQYKLEKYTSECGLKNVHFHVLRHTFATRCVEVGFEMKSLSEILGHTSPSFTLERYVHSSMGLKRDNMDKLASIGY